MRVRGVIACRKKRNPKSDSGRVPGGAMMAAESLWKIMEVTAKQILTGLKEICNYTAMSETLVLKLIRTARFPARKTEEQGGTWISSTEAIDKWAYAYANSGIAVNLKRGGNK